MKISMGDVSMPEGWKRLVRWENGENDFGPGDHSTLMKEMAEALELYESGKAMYPSMGSGGPAHLVLKKWREWK